MTGCIEIRDDRGKEMIIGDTNARVCDSEVEGVVGTFEAPGANENERNLIEMCTEKRQSGKYVC